MELQSAKVVITGGAKGMGHFFARAAAEAGAKVCVGDVDQGGLRTLPSSVHHAPLDVTSTESRKAFLDEASEALGGINVLINNAGILRDALLVKKDRKTGEISVLSDDQWQQVLDVNLTGATMMVRDTVERMLTDQLAEGVIVNMSSISRYGNRGQSNYVASKAALAANTVTWAREFAPFNIRVGAIAPGMIETPMTQEMSDRAREAAVGAVPLKRIGQPEEVWKGLQFIIECTYFTGSTIDIHGGLTF